MFLFPAFIVSFSKLDFITGLCHVLGDLFTAISYNGDHGSTVVKVLCCKSEGRWFDPSWCQWIFHCHKILPIALWPWG